MTVTRKKISPQREKSTKTVVIIKLIYGARIKLISRYMPGDNDVNLSTGKNILE